MRCYKPVAIEDPKTGDYMNVPCRKCNFCLANRRDDWAFRLGEEEKISSSCHFITLTYDQKHVPRRRKDNSSDWVLSLKKEHAYRFLKTIKQAQRRIDKSSIIRYYMVGEYGTDERYTKRPHYHLIMMNLHPKVVANLQIGEYWNKGIIDCQAVQGGAHAYVAKYMIDRGEWEKNDIREKPFSSMSKGNRNGLKGIGHVYWEKNQQWHRAKQDLLPDDFRYHVVVNGYRKRLPDYYKKLFWELENEDRRPILEESKKEFFKSLKREADRAYQTELERLKSFHKFPEEYYAEQLKQKYDQVRIKSLKLNSI